MTLALAYDETASDIEGQDGSGLLVLNGRTIPAKFHPLAQLFPMIEGEAFAALVEDVRANGVRRPIVLFEDMILDGRNRYLAAREAETSYPVVEFSGPDAVAFVISENIHRRHLTESQRAMVAGKLAKMPRGANQHSGGSANLRMLPSASQAAEQLNVSSRMVETARAVVRDGSPELVAAVDAGSITVSAAAEVAKLPEPAQAQVVAEGPAAVRETARAIRQDASVVARVEAGEPIEKARTEPKPPKTEEEVERAKIAKLTDEAKIDEILGLRADLADEKAKTREIRDQVADLKVRLAEATSDDLGKALGNAQRREATAVGRMKEYQAETARLGRRVKTLDARVKELESMPVTMA